jgi:hypothetical protein
MAFAPEFLEDTLQPVGQGLEHRRPGVYQAPICGQVTDGLDRSGFFGILPLEARGGWVPQRLEFFLAVGPQTTALFTSANRRLTAHVLTNEQTQGETRK